MVFNSLLTPEGLANFYQQTDTKQGVFCQDFVDFFDNFLITWLKNRDRTWTGLRSLIWNASGDVSDTTTPTRMSDMHPAKDKLHTVRRRGDCLILLQLHSWSAEGHKSFTNDI